MAQTRTATAHWQGDLLGGNGAVSTTTPGVLTESPLTWRARAEASDTGLTSPEELLAAAHAACFSMAFSNILSKGGNPPTRVDTSVAVTADKREPGWTVISSAITVRATVPGIEEAAFQAAADAAKAGCPISRAIAGNVELSVTATLEG